MDHSLSAARSILGLSRTALYEEMATGRLRAVEIPAKLVIPHEELERWKAQREVRPRGRPPGWTRMTHEMLVQVAKIYSLNKATGKPTKAVQDAFQTSHRSAGRWVAQARDRGLLEN